MGTKQASPERWHTRVRYPPLKRLTVLKVSSLLFLISLVIYTGMNWKVLSYEEGWGVVGMIGLGAIALLGLGVDLILSSFIKNRLWLNIAELVVVLLVALELYQTIYGG